MHDFFGKAQKLLALAFYSQPCNGIMEMNYQAMYKFVQDRMQKKKYLE